MQNDQTAFFVRLYTEDYGIIRTCLESLNDEQIWRPTPAGVSTGNLICHVCEMERFWIDWGLGGRPFDRDREYPFNRTDCTKADLFSQIDNRTAATLELINNISEDAWRQERSFHGDTFTGDTLLLWHLHHLGLHRGHIQAQSRWLAEG